MEAIGQRWYLPALAWRSSGRELVDHIGPKIQGAGSLALTVMGPMAACRSRRAPLRCHARRAVFNS